MPWCGCNGRQETEQSLFILEMANPLQSGDAKPWALTCKRAGRQATERMSGHAALRILTRPELRTRSASF